MDTSRPQVERGHQDPFVRQFSIFLPNRVGELHDLLDVLRQAGIHVAAISVVDSTDWAVVRMVFGEPDKAREEFRRRKIAFTECDVLAVVVTEPDTLQLVCKAIMAAELNVQFAYPLLTRHEGRPVMVLHVDDEIMAVQVLRRHGFTLLDHEDE